MTFAGLMGHNPTQTGDLPLLIPIHQGKPFLLFLLHSSCLAYKVLTQVENLECTP